MSDWNTVQRQMEFGNAEMWRINEAFLDQQVAQGKSFIFTANPVTARPDSYLYQEVNYLKNSGYTIQLADEGLYRAIKKRLNKQKQS